MAQPGAGGFVGRRAELAALHDALRGALEGRGRLVLALDDVERLDES